MKKLKDKIRSRFETCPGVKRVEFHTTLHVDIIVSKNNFTMHKDLIEAEQQIRKKYPGMGIAFRYIIDNLNTKGEGK